MTGGEKEFQFSQQRRCRSCKGAITVTREVWQGKERFMMYHAIPECDWFKQVKAARQAQVIQSEIAKKEGRK